MNLSIAQLDNYASNAGFSGTGLAIIVGIAMAESGGRTDATNSVGNSAGTDRGVLQINSFYHSEVSDACAFDPACSFRQAYRISRNGSSFTPWATYNNGAYKKYVTTGSTSIISKPGPSAASIDTGISTLNTSASTGILTNWIATMQPLIAWLSQPMRIFKLVTGIALTFLALTMLVSPGTVEKLSKGLQYVPKS